MKQNLTLLLVLISLIAYSQDRYKKGYIIDNSGNKIDCLIEDLKWRYNPTTLNYKLNDNSSPVLATISTINEFSVPGLFKYVKQKVDVDISSNSYKNLEYNSEPNWENRTVFLKVLVEGESSLYSYITNELKRYFYNLDNGKILQLVYKKYNLSTSSTSENNYYKQQLINSFLDCDKIARSEYLNLNYSERMLSNIVVKYNSCKSGESENYVKEEVKPNLNLNVFAGLNMSSVTFQSNQVSTLNPEFNNVFSKRFGIEAELIFLKDQLAMNIGLAKTEKIDENTTIKTSSPNNPTQSVNFKFNSYEFILGIRYYIHLNNELKTSFKLTYTLESPSEIFLDYEFSPDVEGQNSMAFPSIGAGLHYKNFNLEAQFYFKGDSLVRNDSRSYDSSFNSLGLSLGYTIF